MSEPQIPDSYFESDEATALVAAFRDGWRAARRALTPELLAKAIYEAMSSQYADRYADTYPAVEWDELGPGSVAAWTEDAAAVLVRLIAVGG